MRGREVGRLEVRAELVVVVADAHPVVAVEPEPVGEPVVVGRGEAALAGHQVLRGVQAEHRRPELAGPAAAVRRAEGLRGVLDDREAVALGDRDERVHVGHEAVQVDGHDRLRARRDRRLDEVGVHAEVVGSRMSTKTGRAPAWRIALAVALKVKLTVMTSSPGPIPSAAEDRLQGHRPVGHEDRVPHAAVGGPGLLELGASGGPWRACRSGGRSRTAPSSAGPMSGFESGITREPPWSDATQRSPSMS